MLRFAKTFGLTGLVMLGLSVEADPASAQGFFNRSQQSNRSGQNQNQGVLQNPNGQQRMNRFQNNNGNNVNGGQARKNGNMQTQQSTQGNGRGQITQPNQPVQNVSPKNTGIIAPRNTQQLNQSRQTVVPFQNGNQGIAGTGMQQPPP